MRILVALIILLSIPVQAGTISIVIDDVGDNERLALRSLHLDSRVALSILPHTPFSRSIAQLAQKTGNDIMLHQPMESYRDNHLLGPGPILTEMHSHQLRATLNDNLDAIPGVIGVNNHMGSRLTEEPAHMAWFMSELSKHDLFYLDSKTSAKSIAADIARKWAIPNASRHVFLDHIDSPAAINQQFKRLVRIAKKRGHAIAIGHPKENTLAFLEQALQELDTHGVQLLAIGDYINTLRYRPLATPDVTPSCSVLEELGQPLTPLKRRPTSRNCSPILRSYIQTD